MKRKQTILFLTEISFYPVFGGEQLRTYGLLKILSQTFDRVYALTDLKEADETVRHEFPNVHFHAFDYNQIRVIIRGFGYFVQFRKDERFLEEIERILTNQKIDLVFIDYKYYGQYIGYFRNKGLPVIYGTHNVQSRIMWQKPADSLRMYLRYKIFYLTHYLHEKIYFPRADKVLAVSQHDARYYGRYMDRSKIVVLPNFLDEELYRIKKVPGEEYIIMTGNFLAFQNETGIDWFVGNVWSDELAGRIKLILAGIGSKDVFQKVSAKYTFKNIEAVGEQDDLKGLIRNARISIVPLLTGSGTRLKCIEAMALKTQIVSTSRGSEGIEHEGNILIADSAAEFRDKILEVLDGKVDTTDRAYDIFMAKYSLAANRLVFQEMLTSLSPVRERAG